MDRFCSSLKKGWENTVISTECYIENPRELPGDLWEWIKENKLTCALTVGGIIVDIGFKRAGPVLGFVAAGWQAGIGFVAGPLFEAMQWMAMMSDLPTIGGVLFGSVFLNSGLLESIMGFRSYGGPAGAAPTKTR